MASIPTFKPSQLISQIEFETLKANPDFKLDTNQAHQVFYDAEGTIGPENHYYSQWIFRPNTFFESFRSIFTGLKIVLLPTTFKPLTHQPKDLLLLIAAKLDLRSLAIFKMTTPKVQQIAVLDKLGQKDSSFFLDPVNMSYALQSRNGEFIQIAARLGYDFLAPMPAVYYHDLPNEFPFAPDPKFIKSRMEYREMWPSVPIDYLHALPQKEAVFVLRAHLLQFAKVEENIGRVLFQSHYIPDCYSFSRDQINLFNCMKLKHIYEAKKSNLPLIIDAAIKVRSNTLAEIEDKSKPSPLLSEVDKKFLASFEKYLLWVNRTYFQELKVLARIKNLGFQSQFNLALLNKIAINMYYQSRDFHGKKEMNPPTKEEVESWLNQIDFSYDQDTIDFLNKEVTLVEE